jgi:hypothetical protein
LIPVTLADVLDLRAYERVRGDYRRQVMEKKRLRRVPLGPITTALFETFDTVRFQVQEMARAERMLSDEAIQGELDVYNRLLPAKGELSVTLFIELTSDEDLRRWLPALRGVERSLEVRIGDERSPSHVIRSVPEASHAEALTREDVTPAVHYLRLPFTEPQVAAFAAGPAELAIEHPAYRARTPLGAETRSELLQDLEGRTEPLPIG